MNKMTLTQMQNDPEVQRAFSNMNEDLVGGRVCIDLDESSYEDPTDTRYEIDQPMDDLILAEYMDEDDNGMKRDGIYIPTNISETKAWRVGRVLKVGPRVPAEIKPGMFVKFPSDKGLITISGKRKMIFLNADRVFCTLKLKPEFA